MKFRIEMLKIFMKKIIAVIMSLLLTFSLSGFNIYSHYCLSMKYHAVSIIYKAKCPNLPNAIKSCCSASSEKEKYKCHNADFEKKSTNGSNIFELCCLEISKELSIANNFRNTNVVNKIELIENHTFTVDYSYLPINLHISKINNYSIRDKLVSPVTNIISYIHAITLQGNYEEFPLS